MNKCYIGVDPGAHGYICAQYEGEFEFFPISDLDLNELNSVFVYLSQKYEKLVCVMEQIHALYGSSAKSTFSFGEIYGKLQALIAANNIPYHLIQPKEWQKVMWSNADMVVTYKQVKMKDKLVSKKVVDTKATSINAAKRLFPTIDFRKSERAKLIDDNKVDACLMSEYARRMNL